MLLVHDRAERFNVLSENARLDSLDLSALPFRTAAYRMLALANTPASICRKHYPQHGAEKSNNTARLEI